MNPFLAEDALITARNLLLIKRLAKRFPLGARQLAKTLPTRRRQKYVGMSRKRLDKVRCQNRV